MSRGKFKPNFTIFYKKYWIKRLFHNIIFVIKLQEIIRDYDRYLVENNCEAVLYIILYQVVVVVEMVDKWTSNNLNLKLALFMLITMLITYQQFDFLVDNFSSLAIFILRQSS